MSASALTTVRGVYAIQTLIFPEGSAFTVPSAANASVSSKPGAADTGWLNWGNIPWSYENTSKTEDYLAPQPGAYVLTDKIVLSIGGKLTGKVQKNSAAVLGLSRAAIAAGAGVLPSTATTVYNPLSGSPVLKAWLHLQMYNVNNVLVDTLDLWCALMLSKQNFDDKVSEADITADILYSTLNVGTLA